MPNFAVANLKRQWAERMKFRIGHHGTTCLSQLPDFSIFLKRFPFAGSAAVPAAALGMVFGAAVIKIYRPVSGGGGSLDYCGGQLRHLVYMFGDIKARYRQEFAESMLATIGCVTEMALRAPDRLVVLRDRIDALTNEQLHCMALRAVCDGEAYDIFGGLYQ